ncbi:MAG: capsular biosynthesis protein [Alphaproteobacteria bacterium]|nr:capsular biosynthesis protein [Alphaproteobacteria bacterium]
MPDDQINQQTICQPLAAPPANEHQTILFLQGHPSTFARNLGIALEERGCRVLRINFCFGDWIYWLGRPAFNYRGSFADWESYLTDFIERENVTDILYYGDCRPYHRVAGDVANRLGIRAMAYEFGYLRPDWLTLERYGMSSRSHFPNEAALIQQIGAEFGPVNLEPRFRHSVALELTHEIFYNLSSYFMGLFYLRYKSDRYYNPLIEYMTGIPKQFRVAANARRAGAIMAQLEKSQTPFFLYPLQLQNDYQLRHHAAFEHQSDAIRAVIASFATHADHRDHLVFKCHPLDNGGEGWPRHIVAAAEQHGVSSRVHYIDGGNLTAMLERARGCVLINSTVGMHAIALGCPTKVLGGAIFDIAGLSHQGPLDTFWQSPATPDRELANALIRAMAGTIQIKGSFFSKDGQAAAIPTFVKRITERSVNGCGAFVSPPPRLDESKRHKL